MANLKYFQELAGIRNWCENELKWLDVDFCDSNDLNALAARRQTIQLQMDAISYLLDYKLGITRGNNDRIKPSKDVLIQCFKERLAFLEETSTAKNTYHNKRMYGVCNYYLSKLGYDVWFQTLPDVIPCFETKHG